MKVSILNAVEPVITSGLIGPSSFSFMPDGNILVVDECAHQLKIFNESGNLVKSIGEKGNSRENFYYPLDAVVLGDMIYMADRYNHKIKALDLNGNILWEAGGLGSKDDQLKEPYGIAAFNKDSLAVTDFGNVKVKIYTTSGEFVSSFGTKGINKEYYESHSFKTTFIYDVWIRSYTRFFTLDTNFAESGYTIGSLERPKGLVSDGENIYVCDYSGRIQVFQKDGRIVRTLFSNDEENKDFAYIQWLQLMDKTILFSSEGGKSVMSVNETGNVVTFFESEDHYVEYFRIKEEYLYFMSPWEKKLFRVKLVVGNE